MSVTCAFSDQPRPVAWANSKSVAIQKGPSSGPVDAKLAMNREYTLLVYVYK